MVSYVMPPNKSSLSRANNITKAPFNSFFFDLRDAFVDSVTTKDGSVIMH